MGKAVPRMKSGDLRPDFEKYGQVDQSREDSGLLTDEAAIRVLCRKDGTRFRAQWSPAGALDPIQRGTDAGWARAEGDIKQRFPVRMYSQKQIFGLARTPLALLRVVDEAPEVDFQSWEEQWKAEEGRFLALRAKARWSQACSQRALSRSPSAM